MSRRKRSLEGLLIFIVISTVTITLIYPGFFTGIISTVAIVVLLYYIGFVKGNRSKNKKKMRVYKSNDYSQLALAIGYLALVCIMLYTSFSGSGYDLFDMVLKCILYPMIFLTIILSYYDFLKKEKSKYTSALESSTKMNLFDDIKENADIIHFVICLTAIGAGVVMKKSDLIFGSLLLTTFGYHFAKGPFYNEKCDERDKFIINKSLRFSYVTITTLITVGILAAIGYRDFVLSNFKFSIDYLWIFFSVLALSYLLPYAYYRRKY